MSSDSRADEDVTQAETRVEESLISTELNAEFQKILSDLESVTRPSRLLEIRAAANDSSTPDGDCGHNRDGPLSPSAYKMRLSTFRLSTYFAKPPALSPLVCARFGYTNPDRDMLVCCHPTCRATVCIAFHTTLSARSVSRLTATYREMLATSHKRDCPFRDDADRWLRDDRARVRTPSRSVRETNFVVPPYLIPMSDEFALLEIAGCGGRANTRRIISEAYLRLVVRLKLAGGDESELSIGRLEMPKEVSDFLVENFAGDGHGPLSPEFVSDRIYSLLELNVRQRENSTGEEIEVSARVLNDTSTAPGHTEAVIEKRCAVLAAFGWRENGSVTLPNDHFIVQCGICMAIGAVPLFDSTLNSTSEPRTKKRRIHDVKVKDMHLVSSHRSFCPYVCGFITATKFETNDSAANDNDDESKPAWKVILRTLFGNNLECAGDFGDAEDAFKSVRKMLRIAFSPSQV